MMADTASCIGVLIAAAGLAIGLYQFRANSTRARAIKAVDEMEGLFKDEAVQRALEIIDYGQVTLQFGKDPNGYALVVSGELLRRSLVYHGDTGVDEAPAEPGKDERFSADERLIRDTFDTFLVRLERIENLIRNGVITKTDFGDLFSYWLELMGEHPRDSDSLVHFGNQRRKRLWRYIRKYRFNGVVRLFHRYDRALQPTGIPTQLLWREKNSKISL
jgi:hypothetical protein